jgi:hypothetical protein
MERNDLIRVRPASGAPFLARITFVRPMGNVVHIGYATDEHGGLAFTQGSITVPPAQVEVVGHHTPHTKRRRRSA